MKRLETIQKIFGVFERLAMVAMIVSFLVLGATLLGLFCTIAWQVGGTLGFDNAVFVFGGAYGLGVAIFALLSGSIFALTDGVLFLSAWRYFQEERADGTPFTSSGADRMRKLGIHTIVLPIVACCISAVLEGVFDLPHTGDWDNGICVVLGIGMILVSLIFRYGAELEAKAEG